MRTVGKNEFCCRGEGAGPSAVRGDRGENQRPGVSAKLIDKAGSCLPSAPRTVCIENSGEVQYVAHMYQG
jgi:hypothetical protein